jgi:hypothetical protein
MDIITSFAIFGSFPYGSVFLDINLADPAVISLSKKTGPKSFKGFDAVADIKAVCSLPVTLRQHALRA